jgi:hypothetical protein
MPTGNDNAKARRHAGLWRAASTAVASADVEDSITTEM